MKFRTYYKSLSDDEKEAFARRAGVAKEYIYVHLMASPPRRVPRRKAVLALAAASNGRVSLYEVLEHFYPELDETEVAA